MHSSEDRARRRGAEGHRLLLEQSRKVKNKELLAEPPSLGAHAELLHVMDAVLVNQTDVKGGKVQNESFVQLQNKEEEEEVQWRGDQHKHCF